MGASQPPLTVATQSFQTQRGPKLHVITVSQPKPLGILVFHHGFGEHGDRHLDVLKEIATRTQLLIVTYDVHGHARSEPLEEWAKALVRSWRHLVQDFLDVVDNVGVWTQEVALPFAKEQGAPEGVVFAAGHSMGGLTILLASAQRPGFFKGLLCSSPLVDVCPNRSWLEYTQVGVLRTLNLFISTRPFLPRKTIEAGVRDPAGVAKIEADNMWYRGPIKLGTVVSCVDATFRLQAQAKSITLPLYFQQGTEDKTCNVIALRRLLPRLGSKDVTYFEVQGGRHDLSHDPETPECVDRMVSWINERKAGSQASKEVSAHAH